MILKLNKKSFLQFDVERYDYPAIGIKCGSGDVYVPSSTIHRYYIDFELLLFSFSITLNITEKQDEVNM